MAVRPVPAKFAAEDGEEFDTVEEAALHDQLITARREYDEARQKWSRAVAVTQKTADGELFDFGSIFRSYYFVTEGYFSMPEVKEVSFLGWNFENGNNDDVIITRFTDDRRIESFAIKDLYTDKRKAEEACLEAQEAKIAELIVNVREYREKLFGKSVTS